MHFYGGKFLYCDLKLGMLSQKQSKFCPQVTPVLQPYLVGKKKVDSAKLQKHSHLPINNLNLAPLERNPSNKKCLVIYKKKLFRKTESLLCCLDSMVLHLCFALNHTLMANVSKAICNCEGSE